MNRQLQHNRTDRKYGCGKRHGILPLSLFYQVLHSVSTEKVVERK
jgi:hypothetical protein